jgi:ssDNA-binding Zn-finger/Zn-ribbon topoisomerase 1
MNDHGVTARSERMPNDPPIMPLAAPPAPKAPPTHKQKISEAGDRTEAGLACPKCGGLQFKVKRSTGRKLGAVAAAPVTGLASMALLAKGTQVRCVTCGTVYKRG